MVTSTHSGTLLVLFISFHRLVEASRIQKFMFSLYNEGQHAEAILQPQKREGDGRLFEGSRHRHRDCSCSAAAATAWPGVGSLDLW